MTNPLGRLTPKRKSGDETFHADGRILGSTLLDFWHWSTSDLVSNATRGVLAEFLVATALNIPLDGVRDEWAACDLVTPAGVKIEVKSAAYIQSWDQRKLSPILFRIAKTRSWNSHTSMLEETARRQADVYVFALLAHTHKPTIDPLNVAQWRFYVLHAATLDARRRSQNSITLASLEHLSGGPDQYENMCEAIKTALGG